MAIATYQYITIQEMIAQVKGRLKLTNTTSEDPILRQYLSEGAGEMMTTLDLPQFTATINIDCFVAELPCNFVGFNRGSECDPPLVFTVAGRVQQPSVISSCYAANFNVVYTGGPFLTASPYQGFSCDCGIPIINIQNGKIYFSNNVDATECTISYMGLNVDENGKILIPKLNARPLTNFAMYQWCLDNGKPWQEYQRIWTQGKRHRTGLANLPDPWQKAQISRIMNTL
jgi:hypothetical protein